MTLRDWKSTLGIALLILGVIFALCVFTHMREAVGGPAPWEMMQQSDALPKWQKARVVGNKSYPEDNGRALWIKIGSRDRRLIYEMKTGHNHEETCYETNLLEPGDKDTIVYGVDVIELLPEFAVDVPRILITEWLVDREPEHE